MRILVVGAGAVGRYLSVRLCRGGAEVALLDRDRDRARQTNERGIHVSGGDLQGEVVPVPTFHVDDPIPPVQILISCVKAHDTERAMGAAVRHLEEDGLILVLSNGLGNLEAAERHRAADHCLAGTIACGVMRDGSGGIRFHGPGRLRIGSRRGLAPDAPARRDGDELRQVFQDAGLECESVSDIEPVIWEKVAVNCAINPLGTILRVPNGRLPDRAAFADGVAASEEAAAVARSLGLNLPVDGWRERAEEVCRNTASNRCSMLVDLEEGRRTEIDSLCGEVGRLGLESGVPTPTNDLFARLVNSLSELTRALEEIHRETPGR